MTIGDQSSGRIVAFNAERIRWRQWRRQFHWLWQMPCVNKDSEYLQINSKWWPIACHNKLQVINGTTSWLFAHWLGESEKKLYLKKNFFDFFPSSNWFSLDFPCGAKAKKKKMENYSNDALIEYGRQWWRRRHAVRRPLKMNSSENRIWLNW